MLLAAALAFGALTACNSLLDVPVPSRIPASSVEDVAHLPLLASGAVADFDCALGSYIVVGGELTDEFEDVTQTAARWVYDQRSVPTDQQRYASADCDAEGTYVPTNRARESADNVLRIAQGATQADMPGGMNRDSLIAIISDYAGYSRILLGEMFCSSVISTVLPDGSVQYGTELTSAQMFASADSMFTQAIASAQSSGNSDALNMAYIGRARTRLDLGQYDAAKADAMQVTDSSYVHYSTASATTGRRENRVWDESHMAASIASSVGPRYQNMTVDGVPDPRVPAQYTGNNSTKGVPEWAQLKYPDVSSPIPIAKWAEAQLIIAEADARAGDAGGAVAVIDELHQRAGLPPYAGSTSSDSVLSQVVEERSRELWLEGQRLFDVRRLNLSLQPPPGAPYRNGGVYGPDGSQLCLGLPDIERQNNPNLNH